MGIDFATGSLSQRLSNRKKYIDLIDANVSSQKGGSTQPNDTSHNYTKIVRTITGLTGCYSNKGKLVRVFAGQMTSFVPPHVPSLTTGDRYVPYGASAVPYNQRSVNSALINMAPQPALPIGETIVELLSGNLPGLLKSFQKNLNSFQRLQTAGSDYLSVQFAWKPLVSDAVKVIETLMAADHIIYGQKFRRNRVIRETQVNHSWTERNSSYTTGLNGQSAGAFASHGQSFDWNHRMSHSINARFNNGARPTRKQYGFYDKAMELLFNLGLDDPALGWNVTKFSWLTDWAVDIGGSLQIASNFSQQTGRYPMDYATLSTKSTTVLMSNPTGPRLFYSGTTYWSETTPGVSVCFVFDRQNLSPFRPGVSLTSLNGFQYSILVALGLAKSR